MYFIKFISPADTSHKLTCFAPTDEEEIRKVAMKSPSKSCELDPLPTQLIKVNIDILAPYITNTVNKSLLYGIFPQSLHKLHMFVVSSKSLLWIKKSLNYRLISNLKFLGKTIERIVLNRISDHITTLFLSDLHVYQSGYKQYHGTETALLRVNNDIFLPLTTGKLQAWFSWI